MRVELPVESAAEVEVDVQPQRLLLRVPGRLRLDLPLPLAVRVCHTCRQKSLLWQRFFQPHASVMPSWQSRVLVQRAPGTAAAHCGARVLAVYPVIMHSLMLTQYNRVLCRSNHSQWYFFCRKPTGNCLSGFTFEPCRCQVHAKLFIYIFAM